MTASAPIVTRFAPSPTGYLHIGGARTALFNWLYARRFGGTYRLRIEDTDRARSTTAAIDAILEGLNWLGLGHDGEVVYQFARAERHRAVALQMLQAGHAYYCYATPEELDEMRAQQKAEGRPMRYDGRWRDRQPPPGHVPNTPPVVRLRAPQTGETTIRDRVQGDVVFRNDVLDDFVLLRGDGTPTYMLSVVVDDYDMGVTHVIRGDDHLTNAARQVQIIQAMDWPVPVYAHLPMLHGEDGAKLSKRHGAQGVHEYQDMGILPEAMRNYLLRLGWSHGNDEIISTAQALEWFDLDAIGRNPARVDMKRLAHLNGHYLRETPDADVTASVLSLRARQGLPEVTPIERDRLEKAMPGLKQRAKSLVELIDQAGFIFMQRPLAMDEKAAKILTPEARQLLGRLRLALADAAFDAPALEAAVRLFAEAEGVKLGDAAQPLRAALSGRSVSPPVFDVMAALGRDESLGRLTDQAL